MSSTRVSTVLLGMMFLNHLRVLCAQGCQLIVVIVTVKEGLNAVPSQDNRILPHLLSTVILPFAVRILCIEIVFFRWYKGRLDFFGKQLFPVVVFEPNMLFNFQRTIKTESVDWLSLYKLVDKIGCLKAPSGRNLILSDLHLL